MKYKIIHGLSKHPLHTIWSGIKRRCNKPAHAAFKWYGAKGIKMCLEWENNFKLFYDWCIENGWKKGLSIDRTDNNKGYSPENCKFIARSLNSKKRNVDSPVNHEGYKNPNAKLNLESMRQLKNDLMNNRKIKELIAIYNISSAQIYRIKNGLRWNSIDPLIQQLD